MPMSSLKLVLLFSLLALNSISSNAENATSNISIERNLFKIGDDMKWRLPSHNEQDWSAVKDGLPESQANYWIRSNIHVNQETISSSTAPMGIFTTVTGSYELYWDGVLINKSGIVGTDQESEIPGPIYKISAIPNALFTQGEHTISLRVSSYHSSEELRTRNYYIHFGPYEELLNKGYIEAIIPIILLGGLILIAIYYLQLYFLYSKEKAFLIFGILCFFVAGLLITETIKSLIVYSYDWHLTRLRWISGLTFIIAVLLPSFFLTLLNMRCNQVIKILFIIMLVSVFILNESYDFSSKLMLMISFISSLVITCIAVIKKYKGALLSLIGVSPVVITMLLLPNEFQDKLFFTSFAFLILTTLFSLTMHMKTTRSERDSAISNSSQLEISLLKKNIQPHFILNTLTSIEYWIEEDSSKAIDFIDSLADEFRVMNTIYSKKLIPLSQELELCQSHLKIMSYRKNTQYELQCEVEDLTAKIPPAIIHTLIENIFSHNTYSTSSVIFKLQQIKFGEQWKYQLKTPLGSRSKHKSLETKLGSRYITARLTESFGSRWEFKEQETKLEWITTLTFTSNKET
jgi:sensor histidine kinase YesM